MSFEDRQALPGDKSENAATDYSATEIEQLTARAVQVTMCSQRSSPKLTALRGRTIILEPPQMHYGSEGKFLST